MSSPAAMPGAAISTIGVRMAPGKARSQKRAAAPQRAPSDARDHAAARVVAARSIWSAVQGTSESGQ